MKASEFGIRSELALQARARCARDACAGQEAGGPEGPEQEEGAFGVADGQAARFTKGGREHTLVVLGAIAYHGAQMAVDDDDDDSSEGEDILAEIIPTPSESMGSTTADTREKTPSETTSAEPTVPEPPTPPEPPVSSSEPPYTEPLSQEEPTQTAQALRSRTSGASSPPTHAAARAALFANRRRPEASAATTTTETSTATAEAILDQQAAEREDLAGKVFKMAQAMKQQQQSIASSLESEKEVLGRATEGMERTGHGMEVAKGRMGMLTRMTEGKGWWGRMILFAWVYGLMVALMVLVFVMPKLRF